MNKRFIASICSLGVIAITMIGVGVTTYNNVFLSEAKNDGAPYTLTIGVNGYNLTNKSDNELCFTNKRENEFVFKTSTNKTASKDYVVNLYQGQTFTNQTMISGIRSVEVVLDGGSLQYAICYKENDTDIVYKSMPLNNKLTFTSNYPNYIFFKGNYFDATCIKSITYVYDCVPGFPPNDEFNPLDYDPNYPKDDPKYKYSLAVPNLENRFTLNNTRTKATLFAPYVTKTSGWYDSNKNWKNDGRLCWAASLSNILNWYLDVYDATTDVDVSGYTRSHEDIFNIFREHFDGLQGYDPLQGLAWYFTGLDTGNNSNPPEVTKPISRGFLQGLPHVPEAFAPIDFTYDNEVFGNYNESYPFVEDRLSINESYEYFSKLIAGQLHYGPTTITAKAVGATGQTGHALTLWGCEFDVETGLIEKIYVTDSDDESQYPGYHLRQLHLGPSNGDNDYPVHIQDYGGNGVPLKRITDSTCLYAPNIVTVK